MEALEIVMAIYKLNTDRGFDAPSPLPFLNAGQRISIVHYLFLALQGWQNSRVLPEPYDMRLGTTAPNDYGLRILRGEKMNRDNRFNDL